MRTSLDEARLRRLLSAGRALVAQLDLEAVLDELLDAAREITGARYAALGVLDEERTELERFLTRGVDAETARTIGDLPRGRGVLGALIDDPRPLRLDHVGADARSYGFPPGHPPMSTFLGVPLTIRGEAWGNLYLTEKEGGAAFDEADEEAAVLLADWASIAVDNARLYQGVEARRDALERAVMGLEATSAIARAVGGETDLDRVLELIVKRGRALVDARALTIGLQEGELLTVAAGAGDIEGSVIGSSAPLAGGPLDAVIRRLRPERIPDVSSRPGAGEHLLGIAGASSALLVPLVFRGRAVGILCACDRQPGGRPFEDEHEHLLLAFAASAATAVATARTVARERLRHSLRSAEAERSRWARELHDDTLQSLAGLRVLLSGALRRDDGAHLRAAVGQAVDQLQEDIDGLRALITDLRPAALDELGLEAALRALAERVQFRSGVRVTADLLLAHEAGQNGTRLSPDVETAVYRIAQEGLTNAVSHGAATAVSLQVHDDGERLTLVVRDDGGGFDVTAERTGFGITGMTERVELVGGRLDLDSDDDGTAIRAMIPAARRATA